MIAQKWKALDVIYFYILTPKADQKKKVGFLLGKDVMKNEVEFVGVILKVNGKKMTFPKEKVFFSATSSECELCGSHGSVKICICENKKSHEVEVYKW